MDDRLRRLWDFDDLDGTEHRLREQLDVEMSEDGRAEVLSQLARVEGLRGDYERADALAEDASARAEGEVARARVDLEVLENAVAWTERVDKPDGHEELAEEYAGLGRAADASEQARLAIPLLERDDPSFPDDVARRERLGVLAAG